jgi:large subunit ribosomal protein L25
MFSNIFSKRKNSAFLLSVQILILLIKNSFYTEGSFFFHHSELNFPISFFSPTKKAIFAPSFSGKDLGFIFISIFQAINSMESVKINAGARAGLGKALTKVDRAGDAIPCNLYGGNTNVQFTTTWNEVRHLIYTADFKLADITTADGKSYSAIVKDVQFHPVSEKILHIDFLVLTPGTLIKVSLPLRLIGQSPGVKAGGKLLQSMRKIKVKVLPENLVDHVSLSISKLDLGQSARVRDIIATEGVEITMSPSIPVVSIEIPRALRAAAAAEAKAAAGPKKKK